MLHPCNIKLRRDCPVSAIIFAASVTCAKIETEFGRGAIGSTTAYGSVDRGSIRCAPANLRAALASSSAKAALSSRVRSANPRCGTPIIVKTTIHRSPDSFDALRSEWNVLLKQSPSDLLFLTWEFQKTWWDHFGAGCELRVVT